MTRPLAHQLSLALATQGQTLTADTSGIADADGLGAFSYQWLRDGVDISGASGSTYALVHDDVGAQISVRVSYTDGGATLENLTSAQTAAITNINDAPTGAPVITGTVSHGETLTATTGGIGDEDGLGAFTYQWRRDGVDIAGATGSTYDLVSADIGTQISVRVSYVDGYGASESVTSAQTAAVTNINDAPTGSPTLSGTVTQGQTLTVDTSGIGDLDGLRRFLLSVAERRIRHFRCDQLHLCARTG